MVILEFIQWIVIGFIGFTLYQCYKTLKIMLNTQNTLSKSFEKEIRRIYEILNQNKDDER